MPNPSSPNRLIHETSPYLLQHAHNPVEWYPWGDEALSRARGENKPILLSIGYSACHWCHVMAHESFEDEETARLMNALYVNVKVDREERPDLDRIYQLAHQLLTRRGGGWPLTMFLSPQNLVPFFGGTYFPKTPRHGLPGFGELLRAVSAYYHDHHDDIEQQNQQLTEALTQFEFARRDEPAELSPAPLDIARQQLAQSYDKEHGGFGGAPKFPHPPHLERLLRHWAMSKSAGQADEPAFSMAETTLVKMADGGVYDQLGGGFCRYSVDERWMIPHFEKMLYDNGPLLSLYSAAWQITGNPLFHRIATETAEWAMREMQSPQGGYYSTLDADSEGVEGRFYVWRREEIESLLDAEEYRIFARRFGLDQAPNFEGAWHLHVYQGLKNLMQEFSLPRERILELVDTARHKLFVARELRVHPGRDEKILTAWNGLMIKGMAEAGRLLQRGDFIDSATRAVDFIRTHLWRDGRLLVSYKDGRARFAAYLDDYVFLLDGLLSLLQTRWRDEDIIFAMDLAEAVLTHFEDREHGGFFFTAHDHEALLYRPKTLADEALPAGNGVAAMALGRLGHLLGEVRYLDAAERTLKAASAAIQDVPYAYGSLLTALEEYLYPPQFIVLRGDGDAVQSWLNRCRQFYAPRRYAFAIPATAVNLPARLASCVPAAEVTAYVCNESSCSAPVTQLSEFEAFLNGAG